MRATLRRWHIWLGWAVLLPTFLWFLSGLVMTLRPMSEVRSEDLLREPPVLPVLDAAQVVAPEIGDRPATRATIEQRAGGPRWIVTFLDGQKRMADPATGKLLMLLDGKGAADEVRARLARPIPVRSVTFIDRENPPGEARGRAVDWRVELADGTHLFVDRQSGEIVARRSRWWRVYDLFWRIHILDFSGEERIDNPLLLLLAALSLAMTILGAILLPKASGGKKKAR